EMWTEKSAEPLLEIIHARHWIEDKMRLAGWSNDALQGAR
ncbi:TPA: L-ribulose-5-phosphate 3-epimerase, partial [Yersinia enterocolitica]